MSHASAPNSEPYEVRSIEPSDAPEGMDGPDWFRYEIGQGDNTIKGYRNGSKKNVKDAVEAIVVQLNERRFGKRGRVQFIPTPKKTKKKKR